jgi:predicted metal-dependent hydrolase
MHGTITYSTHKLDYLLRFSNRGTMAITVYPNGEVEVVAPRGTTQHEVEIRLRKRARWILRQRLHFEQFRPRSPARRYVGGETHLYLGRQYRLKLTRSKSEAVKLKGPYLWVASYSCNDPSRVGRLVMAWYREKAKVRLKERFDAIAPRFILLGYKPSPPILRSMPRRWGSYNSTGRVLLNPDLKRAPVPCIDYVITHELVHIVHPNHGPKFYELLEALMPDWLSRKARLEHVLS